ncbi:MAG: tripartite tricarboxylate transporter substrate binding protein [Proteobacteria bacterium]|nr:tripartite tricarboxylate transporter substrate binding protein [Pseudomonadota bacterium]
MIDRRALLATAASLTALPLWAQTDDWPQKPLTLVVPFTPGGSTDILARVLSQKLGDALGKSVVVENRPGAGGSIGAELVARAAPDGYTMLMGHIGTLAVNKTLYVNLAYDPLTSFMPVSQIAAVHNLLVVHPSIPARNLKELIAYAKANPGTLTYGTGGNGSAAHIATVALADAAGIDLVHVPYKGTAPAVTDLLAGRISMAFTGAPVLLPHIQAGKLRPLAISGAKRLATLPDIPTVAEAADLPGFEASQWYGIVVPAGTPATIVARLNAEIRKGMSAPENVERLAKEGADIIVNAPDAFGNYIAAEIQRWGALIKRANIKPD